MGFFTSCGRGIIVLLNIIFLILGLLMLVLGCIGKFGGSFITKYLDPLFSSLSSLTSSAGHGLVDTSNFDIGSILGSAAIALIVTGAVLFAIALFGCCGACCKIRWMIVVYAVVILFILIAEIVLVALIFTKKNLIDSALQAPLMKVIQTEYVGIDGSDAASLGWNFVMVSLQCCGVNSYLDFHGATNWKNIIQLPIGGVNITANITSPVACCKVNGTFPDIQMPTDYTCATEPTTNNSNYQQGCYQKIEDVINNNSGIAIGVLAGLAAFQLMLIIFSFVICNSVNEEERGKVHPM